MKKAIFILILLGFAVAPAMSRAEAAPISLSPGDIIVGDSCNQQLLRVDPVTGTQTVVYSGAFKPRGIAFETNGDILITDETVNGGAVIRIDRETGAETIVSSGGDLARGQALGIAIAPDGDIIVAVPGGEFPPAIVSVDPVTGAQTVLAEGYFNDRIAAFVAVASDDTIYFTTGSPTGAIWRISPQGDLSLVSTGGLIQSTAGIAVEVSGTLVVADYDSDSILRIDPITGAQSIVSQGNLLQGQLGLALEADGNIVVADSGWQGGNPEILRIDPATGDQSVVTSDGLLNGCTNTLAVVPPGSGDSDNDGVPDTVDACPNSILGPTVVIDRCDSGVPNTVSANGCTISDQVQQCATTARNHGQFMSCVAHLTKDLKRAGDITGRQSSAIRSCAAPANIP